VTVKEKAAKWRFIESGRYDAFENMAIDEAISSSVRKGLSPPTLRIYGWKTPSLSIGRFQKTAGLDLDYCRTHDIPFVRRPTGGRAVLHDDEITYSFSAPSTGIFSDGLFDSYRRIASAFDLFFRELGLTAEIRRARNSGDARGGSGACFLTTSFSEFTVEGKKIIGSAQRRWVDGLLQQGSIPLLVDIVMMRVVMNLPTGAGKIPFVGLKDLLPELRAELLGVKIRTAFENAFGISFSSSQLTREEEADADVLKNARYRSLQWNLTGAV
jgi:lipoyl(octanoyl) transferase